MLNIFHQNPILYSSIYLPWFKTGQLLNLQKFIKMFIKMFLRKSHANSKFQRRFQSLKALVSAWELLLTTISKVLFLGERLGTTLFLHPVLSFSKCTTAPHKATRIHWFLHQISRIHLLAANRSRTKNLANFQNVKIRTPDLAKTTVQ